MKDDFIGSMNQMSIPMIKTFNQTNKQTNNTET